MMMLEVSTLIMSSPMLYSVRDKHSVNKAVETFCAYCGCDDPQGHMKR